MSGEEVQTGTRKTAGPARSLAGLCCALAVLPLAVWSGNASAKIDGDTVKIGVLNDMSGPLSVASGVGSLEAARMAAEDMGDKINGKPIIILKADHQNRPDIGISIAREWFDRENVSAIVDTGNTAVALGIQNLIKQNHKIVLFGAAAGEELIQQSCMPTSFQWVQDTYSIARGLVTGVEQVTRDPWYFITVDYAFGRAMETSAIEVLKEDKISVLGATHTATGTTDFASALSLASAAGTKVLAANVAGDADTLIKQAEEFGFMQQGVRIAPLALKNQHVHSMGLQLAQGLLTVVSYFDDESPDARKFSDRFNARMKQRPSDVQAGMYSATLHYLRAVQAADSVDGEVVAAKMREMPVNDFYIQNGKIRADGRLMTDLFLVQAKNPAESTGEWDVFKQVARIPADKAIRPLSESTCPLVTNLRKASAP